MTNLARAMVFSLLAMSLMAFAAQGKKPQKAQLGDAKSSAAQPGTAKPTRGKTDTSNKDAARSGTAGDADRSKASDSDVIKVTITTSVPTITTGQSSYGVSGYLRNVSSSSVVVYSKETVLVVQPELTTAHDCVFALSGFFPTEPDNDREPRGARVVIPPHENYAVSWSVSKAQTKDCGGAGQTQSPQTAPLCSWTVCGAMQWVGKAFRGLWEFANFVPGNYAFTVSGKAFKLERKNETAGATSEEVPKSEANTKQAEVVLSERQEPGIEGEYDTFSETAILNVGVPQMFVVLFSGLGGFLAYLVVIFFPDSKELSDARKTTAFYFFKRWFGDKLPSSILRRAFSAMLTSSLFTVVSSRLSSAETAFPIKVSVTDMWGAITFGFIAYFLGGKFINWLQDFGKGNPKTPGPEDKGPKEPDPKAPDAKVLEVKVPATEAADPGAAKAGV